MTKKKTPQHENNNTKLLVRVIKNQTEFIGKLINLGEIIGYTPTKAVCRFSNKIIPITYNCLEFV